MNERTRAWLWATNLVVNEHADKKVVAAKFGWLAARAYPWSNLDGVQLASDWATWLFMRDDMCDEAGFRADPIAMREHCDGLIRVLSEGPTGGDEADPLVCALADLRARIIQIGGIEKLGRFIGPTVDYFEACVWEAENRQLRRVPSIATYRAMRRYTGGVLTCLAVADVTDDIRPPLQQRDDLRVRRLIEIANDVICWSNDIFSAEKELRENDFHNLVIVVKHALGCTLPAALECVAQMHDGITREFEHLETQVDESVKTFVNALKTWMRANYDWSIDSGRYAPTSPAREPLFPLRAEASSATARIG